MPPELDQPMSGWSLWVRLPLDILNNHCLLAESLGERFFPLNNSRIDIVICFQEFPEPTTLIKKPLSVTALKRCLICR